MPFIDFGCATEAVGVEYRSGGRIEVAGLPAYEQSPQVWLRFGEDGPRVWLFIADAESLVDGLTDALGKHAAALKDPSDSRAVA